MKNSFEKLKEKYGAISSNHMNRVGMYMKTYFKFMIYKEVLSKPENEYIIKFANNRGCRIPKKKLNPNTIRKINKEIESKIYNESSFVKIMNRVKQKEKLLNKEKAL